LNSHLHEFIRKHGNLTRAWQSVSANSRHSTSPYVKDEAKGFAGDEQRRIRSISTRIQRESYRFSPARGVVIEGKGKPGKVRPIVISRVEDRIVQRCLLDAMTQCTDLRETAFQPFSFGGIPKRGDELAGVAAAIKQLLTFVEDGATHVMVADIEGFFTKIPKPACVAMVARHTTDQKFLRVLRSAIDIDLENSKRLWRHKDSFPYGDIGVGQGNCLSPFLGNLFLSDFDVAMNQGDCRCIRYVDDILIAAPSGRAASARFRMGSQLLGKLGMQFAPAKSSKVPIRISDPFEYLGIEFSSEGLRPAGKSRKSIVARAGEVAAESLRAMRTCADSSQFDPKQSVPRTLNRIAGMARGWAHHYAFCNDYRTIQSIDQLISKAFMLYVTKAGRVLETKGEGVTTALLGYRGLTDVRFKPFEWPVHTDASH
jgi:RNA-directed DNA polymerase